MRKLKRDDEVIVIAGRDKGKRGTISQLLGDRALVGGVNMVKRHTRPNPNLGQPGGIVEREATIHVSNIALFNPVTEQADRVKIVTDDDGQKKRVFKSDESDVD